MNVLVYTGSDVSPPSYQDTLSSLRSILIPNYAVQSVSSQALAAHPWSASCALLVLPSLIASTSGSGQGLTPAAAKGIQNYVATGGKLLALGTGLRMQSHRATSSLSLSAQVAGISLTNTSSGGDAKPAKLTLDDTEAHLSFSLTSTAQKDAIDLLQLADGTALEGVARLGGVELVDIQEPQAHGIKTLAHYSTPEKIVAGIQARIGRGTGAFWSSSMGSPLTDNVQDQARLRVLRETLENLGLRLPLSEGASRGHGQARPTPQILSAAPWRPGVVGSVTAALNIPALSEPYEIKDTNDMFLVHSSSEATRVFSVPPMTSDDPATWNPKHIVVYGDAIPPRELTPKFDILAFYNQLAKERKERGCPEAFPAGEWGVGEALLYGEIVTSTQTMLDKNNHLLTSLPAPILSLASAQLTGRGRGSNIWLSPPGCLQFSLLLRVPLASFPAAKIVFVQYLFALAVVEACRSECVLGAEAGSRVRIKWPNDLYAVTLDGEKKKIGGILVNTSFSAGRVELVVGCGLNVLNPPPITSLSQLLPDAPDSQPPPTMERTLAAIMARFERMWSEFVRERGSFEPFMDLYLDRWLHSDQLVTLTTVSPPRQVRIVGITPDHGLLRTMPERDAWTAGGVEYIDLQPDGNSFDLMAGLIKTKT